MKVFVGMIIDTPDYGESEFKKEIEKLILDIDPIQTTLKEFKMFSILKNSNLLDIINIKDNINID